MMTTTLAVVLVAAVLVVGGLRRRHPSRALDVALACVGVAISCMALASTLAGWARIGYLVLGLVTATFAIVSALRRGSVSRRAK